MTPTDLEQYATDPIAFADTFIPVNEKGRPWRLADYQRRVLAIAFVWGAIGLLLRLLLWSEIKKSGKTFVAAVLGLWWGFTRPNTEIIVTSNDLEQSVGRVFATMVALLRFNPELGRSATIRATEILLSNGTVIRAISSDYRGAAGSRHSLVIFDELWGFTLERAERLFEELTPPPSEPDAWVLIVTTAGFTGESALLERLYQRGVEGERLDAELEVYRHEDDLIMFWSHVPRQPWQTEVYYEQQARLLRPSTFARLHRNEWAAAESAFLAPLWDGAVVEGWEPADADPQVRIWRGVDLAFKSDTAAVVDVTVDETTGQVVLMRHRIWRPDPVALDTGAKVLAHLRETADDFTVQAIFVDPWQGYDLIRRLRDDDGAPVTEFPQTEGNTARMGEILYDLLKSRRLVVYPDAELRQQAMNAVGIESARGVRIAKASASRKVDGIVALAMACVATADVPAPSSGPTLIMLGR